MSYLLTNFLPQELVDKIDGIAHDLEEADIATARQEWQNSLATVNSDFKHSLAFNVLDEVERGTLNPFDERRDRGSGTGRGGGGYSISTCVTHLTLSIMT